MTARVYVVIPYFQRTKGLLRRVVESALAQEGFSDFHIIVVDDGSPVPAREELGTLPSDQAARITVVEQANHGVSVARNTGLSEVPEECEFIAFLDSDDIWTPDHLQNAMFALERGYDFYFSDFFQLGQDISAFDRARRIQVADHPLLEDSAFIREYQGDMVRQIIAGNIIGTPVVVYRKSLLPGARFREGLTHAGEDYLFWLDLALAKPKIAFSDKQECRCGEGINLYAGGGWGTDKYFRILADDVRYRKIIVRDYPIDHELRAVLGDRIRHLRISFVRGLLNFLASRQSDVTTAAILGYLKADHAMIFLAGPYALKEVVTILFSRLGSQRT